ncbi:MAG TPA: aldolase/citrate lyase family protein, partial [Variovorax sp.]|nr:aldolase/citrate lyase family protein [Variovorax sp.]
PHVDDAAEAAAAVRACKYPPSGMRSFFGLQPHFDYARHPASEAMAAANAEQLCVVMLESPRAIGNADAIAAVPGVDVLLVGSNDLALEMGIPGQLQHPAMEAAFATVVAACEAHGRHAGIAGIVDPALLRRHVDAGMRFVLTANDIDLLLAAGEACVASLRG